MAIQLTGDFIGLLPERADQVTALVSEDPDALRFWQNLVYKDKVMPSGVLNSKQIGASFFSGKVGMAMLSTGALGFMRENSKDFELGVAMLPAR